MPSRPSSASSREQLARQDALLEPVADLGQHALADELADGVADRALLVVEQRVEREEVERVEGGSVPGSWSPRWVPPSVGTTVIVARAAAAGQNGGPRSDHGRRGRRGRCAVSTICSRPRARGSTGSSRSSVGGGQRREMRSSSTSAADDDRRREGVVPGSLHVPRTVLEWRADPGSRMEQPAPCAHATAESCCSARTATRRASAAAVAPRSRLRGGHGRRRRVRGMARRGPARPARARAADGEARRAMVRPGLTRCVPAFLAASGARS